MLSNFFFTCILVSSLIFITHSYNTQLCVDHQKNLLLQLKNELIFNSSISRKLVQWNQRDECCKWYGVECDDAGYVISLQLDDESISGGIGDSSSLFRLKYLKKLNLAYNDFKSTPIPKGIHNLSYLTHLNFSNAWFSGQVSLQLSFLRSLVSLDISNLYVVSEPLKLEYPNLKMVVRNLTGLRELYLDGVDITSSHERRKWSHIISSYLPDLTTLSLCQCFLSGPFAKSFLQLHSLSTLRLDYNDLSTTLPNLFANLSSLTTLSLVSCGLKGYFPNKIFHIPTLQNIDLSFNELLSGSLPPFPQNGSLESVRLRDTNFSGSIPSSISNLKTLSELLLSGCKFTGSIPSTFANLTQLSYVDLSRNLFTAGSLSSTLFEGLSSLVYLNLEYNSFSGKIPHSLFGLPSLEELNLRDNHFTGQVEAFSIVINVSSIVSLDLSNNQLEGPIPNSLFQLESLEYLWLSDNLFSGSFQLEKIQQLANLTSLDLSHNNLRVYVSNHNSTSYGLPMLEWLGLASCNLNDFPDFIKHSRMIEYVVLSYNRIGGEIPSWIWGLTQLQILGLSNNRIGGEIPSWVWGLTQLQDLDLSRNLLTSLQKPFHIPSSLLFSLNLSNNRIGGEIPSWIWGLTQLERLDLSHNLLTGVQMPYHIPPSLGILDLSSNQLRGELNLLIPPNITSPLQRLLLSNNSLSGSIPTSLCTATQLYALDLSVNKLSGIIPSCLLAMSSIFAIDLGRNNINGRIPDTFSHHCHLQYFDLNNNTLQGKIPRSLKNCKQLELMNVGNNIINDTFPCMLPSSLRVLVLHSNTFHGKVTCHNSWWSDLQILDISSNHFVGSLETINFSSWRSMVQGSDSQLRHKDPGYFNLYSSGMTLIMKGLQVELYKIWSELSSIDFSCNNFRGEIPNAIGDLSLLHHLNLSNNALNGSIPKSFGKLGNLESLDLSRNQLTGAIPMELAGLTFLSFLNLSYNMLVGEIPNGRQIQTFSADSFKGNPWLCGFNLNISCSSHTDDESDLSHEKVEDEKREIEWEYVSAALGYVVGLGSIVWLLLFCRSFRKKYFDKIDDVVQQIFDARDMRRRRRATARRRTVMRNRVRRQ